MDHLWKTCNELHSIDVLALRTKMLTMHEDASGIPEYQFPHATEKWKDMHETEKNVGGMEKVV